MADKNWSQIGDEIEDMVRNALETKDFGQLSQNISRTVGEAMENVGKSVQNAVNKADAKTREAAEKYSGQAGDVSRPYGLQRDGGRQRQLFRKTDFLRIQPLHHAVYRFQPGYEQARKKTERIFSGSVLKIRVE